MCLKQLFVSSYPQATIWAQMSFHSASQLLGQRSAYSAVSVLSQLSSEPEQSPLSFSNSWANAQPIVSMFQLVWNLYDTPSVWRCLSTIAGTTELPFNFCWYCRAACLTTSSLRTPSCFGLDEFDTAGWETLIPQVPDWAQCSISGDEWEGRLTAPNPNFTERDALCLKESSSRNPMSPSAMLCTHKKSVLYQTVAVYGLCYV